MSGEFANNDYATVKYDANGKELWRTRYNGYGSSDDKPSSLTVCANGNAYVTGTSSGDCATLKYDSNGKELWVKKYNGRGTILTQPIPLLSIVLEMLQE